MTRVSRGRRVGEEICLRGDGFFVGVLGVSSLVAAKGDSFLSGCLFSLSAFEVLPCWPVQSRFAGGACFVATGDTFEYVRVRFPSTEDILEQCNSVAV
jgi:hypothetical protein